MAGDVTWFDTGAMDVADPRAPVPIGRPIDRSTALVLDRRMRPLPAGLAGELYVGGDNLADGYHARPDLTDEAFPADPSGSGRLFRTRDVARWNGDGALEFLGRRDGQIKIRGMRVEIGEVEAVLRAEDGVGDAAVRAVPAAGGGLALAAYGPARRRRRRWPSVSPRCCRPTWCRSTGSRCRRCRCCRTARSTAAPCGIRIVRAHPARPMRRPKVSSRTSWRRSSRPCSIVPWAQSP